MMDIAEINQKYSTTKSALCDAMGMPRATFYRQKSNTITADEHSQSKNKPNNILSQIEQKQVLDLLHGERFADKTPYQAFYTLLDEGLYICSIRTMYRLLCEKGETQDRRNQRNHRDAVKPELMATEPNQIWSWDITKLLCTQRLVYYHLYAILDIFSRYVVGWLIADRECKVLARELIHKTALKQGIQPGQLCLHADNGPSMTSGTVAQLLEHLGIAKTHNRPYTSNDNPFSESQFKTLKYCPEFPGRFDSVQDAELFCRNFFNWYNRVHFHSGIQWLTPQSVHYDFAEQILEKRYQTLMDAFNSNPRRFNNKPPQQKILTPVYINPPQTVLINDALQQEVIMMK